MFPRRGSSARSGGMRGNEIIPVNEHTSGAGEMVAAFAEENALATVVGTKTAGRLLSGSGFKAGFGYFEAHIFSFFVPSHSFAVNAAIRWGSVRVACTGLSCWME